MPQDRPNCLLVVLDTARADSFEPYGAKAGATPALRDLATRGAAVTSAYAPSSWTLPSHASLFSGLAPRQVGLGQSPDGLPTGAAPVVAGLRDRWLPEVLRAQGYATRGVSSNVWVSRTAGFDLGFESFAQVSGHRRTAMGAPGRKAALQWAAHAFRSAADAGAEEARGHVDRWLGEGPGQPFFWFVNLLECHSPYLPPRPWNDLGPVDRLRAGREARAHLGLNAIWQASLTGQPPPDEVLERMRHLYLRSVSMMDAWLAGVLEELDRRRILDETVVVVTSDHGENFGEEGLMGHAFSVDERLVKVPLVLAGPGDWDAGRVTGLADLPHLLTKALGVTAPYADDPRLDGVAVSTFDPVAGPDDPATADAQRKWSLGDRGVGMLTRNAATASDGAWKLVRDALGARAYDLTADPLGVTPVAVSTIPADRLRLLDAAVTEAEQLGPRDPHSPTPEMASPDVDVDELEAQLKLLGYL